MSKVKIISFDTLSEDKQLLLQQAYQTVEKLTRFGNKLNLSLLQYLFDKHAKILTELFLVKYNRDVLKWFTSLTLDQKEILLTNIYYNDLLYSHC